MPWVVRLTGRARKDLRALDRTVQKRIASFMYERLSQAEDPRVLGLPLRGDEMAGHWRFRVGDYRLICSFHNEEMILNVVRVGHRREVYERFS